MNQRKWISFLSWVVTIAVLAFGLWLEKKFGPAVMWTVLFLILALTVTLQIWKGSKAARSRLEAQEEYVRLTRGRTIHDLVRQHPDLLPMLRKAPQDTIDTLLEVLDENQARDLQEALSGDGPRDPAD